MIIFFVSYVLLSLRKLYDEMRRTSGPRKKHLQYLFWSAVLGYGLGVVNFFPVYGLLMPPYPYSAACGAIYFAVLGYAILRHKLFDIEVVVKKGMVFALLFGSVFGGVSLGVTFAGYFFMGKGGPVLSAVSIAMAMLIYEPLRRLITRWTNKFLFQKKRSYAQQIQDMTTRLAEIRNPAEFGSELVNYFSSEMELTSAAFYLKDSDGRFILNAQEGTIQPNVPDERLISEITLKRIPLIFSPFETMTRNRIQSMSGLTGIEAAVPFFLEANLEGLLLLGHKKSDDVFSPDDESLLATLMEEVSMLFLLGKLLRETSHASLELGQRTKMAALKNLARGVHHEIRNPLHALALYAGATLEDLRRGALESVDPSAEYAQKLSGRLDAMLDQIVRTSSALGRLAHFARPEYDVHPEALDLLEELHKFLALMHEGHRLDEIQVKNAVRSGLRVRASMGALQDVFFNLFTNAREAMKGRGTLFLEADMHGDYVEMRVRDSGPGISAEILPHIFDVFFSTRTHREAAGVGLAASRRRMESFGGRLEARSEKGPGAEFVLYLPKAA